jgi:predicted ATPase/DNA-binding winged helix-turn-helix (wHTH) protein
MVLSNKIELSKSHFRFNFDKYISPRYVIISLASQFCLFQPSSKNRVEREPMEREKQSTELTDLERLEFGPFQVLLRERVLLKNGDPIDVGSRAFELLILFLKRPGVVLTKDELISSVWSGVFVEESNLRVNIAALRKALGDGEAGNRYILNTPNRGYSFVHPVTRRNAELAANPSADRVLSFTTNVPAPLSKIVGRDDAIDFLASQIEKRRFVTLVGPGGIGKTTVALAAAARLLTKFENRICFVDLAALTDETQVFSKLVNSLGVRVGTKQALQTLLVFFRERRILLIFDNCEHVIGRTAELVEEILHGAPTASVLATSREPLRAAGEYLIPLRTLDFPALSIGLTASAILAYPAVELFIERAAAHIDSEDLSYQDAASIAEICCRLDGIPLAIELTASRVGQYGIRSLASMLDDRFSVLTRGRRTALPRHQTLRATMDWSYDLLTPVEQIILQQLSVFSGRFTPIAARAVITVLNLDKPKVEDAIYNLVSKSLVISDSGNNRTHYRLLETTKAYADEKLDEIIKRNTLLPQHAEYYQHLLERANDEKETQPTSDWLDLYCSQMDNVKAALNWAFSPIGNPSIGVALTVAAIPLWLQLSLIDECRGWVEKCLLIIQSIPGDTKAVRMKLYAALGWPQMYATDSGPDSGTEAWKKALTLAEELNNTEYELRALWALWADRVNQGECEQALTFATKFKNVAARSSNFSDRLIGERITAAVLHFIGDQTGAMHHIKIMLDGYIAHQNRSEIVKYQFDQRITARITLSRTLWLQGRCDQSMMEISACVDDALSIGHVFSLCNFLAQAACPIALQNGNLEEAERYEAMLRNYARSHSIDVWLIYADCFHGELLVRKGQIDLGLTLLRDSIKKLRDANFVQYLTAFLSSFAEGLAASKQFCEAQAIVDEALSRCESTGERWCYANLLRIKANILIKRDHLENVSLTEELYQRSLQVSGEHQCISWALRTGIDFADMLKRQNRQSEACQMLEAIKCKFTEGFENNDFIFATELLEQLRLTNSI